MSRPNKRRDVFAEDNLARRVAVERVARRWSNDGLAERMTRAGCAMTGSAIFKIEKAEPRRRIVVDELVAFSRVFGVPVGELLLPPEAMLSRELSKLVIEWGTARDAAQQSRESADVAWTALLDYVHSHPEMTHDVEQAMRTWADSNFTEDHRDINTVMMMWELTHNQAWMDILRTMLSEDD